MNITITARHLRVTPEMKEYARERAERMWKYYDRIGKIEIVLDVDGEKYTAEFIVSATRHTQVVARAKDADIQAALDKVHAKVERQLTKFKEKIKNHRPRGVAAKKKTLTQPAGGDGSALEEEDWW